MATRMQQRRGTAAEWAAANPVLAEGELGLEEDTGTLKIGDGVTLWNAITNVYKRASEYAARAGDVMTGSLRFRSQSGVRFSGGAADANDDTWLYQDNALGRLVARLGGGGVAEFDAGAIYDTGNRVLTTTYNPFTTIDALGDILVGSGPDAVARLAKGANGMVLTVDGSGNVVWQNPWAVVDAAGDIIVASGPDAVARLAKGANGTVLTVNGSGQVVWQAPAAVDLSTKVSKTGDSMTGKLTLDLDTSGTGWGSASLEIQDTSRPRIAFHQPGAVASQIGQEDNSERIRTYDNGGTGYAEFAAGAIYDSGNRVYSASNPPPVSGMNLLGGLRLEGDTTAAATAVNIGGVNMTPLTGGSCTFTAPSSGRIKITMNVARDANNYQFTWFLTSETKDWQKGASRVVTQYYAGTAQSVIYLSGSGGASYTLEVFSQDGYRGGGTVMSSVYVSVMVEG